MRTKFNKKIIWNQIPTDGIKSKIKLGKWKIKNKKQYKKTGNKFSVKIK